MLAPTVPCHPGALAIGSLTNDTHQQAKRQRQKRRCLFTVFKEISYQIYPFLSVFVSFGGYFLFTAWVKRYSISPFSERKSSSAICITFSYNEGERRNSSCFLSAFISKYCHCLRWVARPYFRKEQRVSCLPFALFFPHPIRKYFFVAIFPAPFPPCQPRLPQFFGEQR